MEERHDLQPMGKSVPRGILSALTLLEQVGQVEAADRLAENSFVTNVVKSWESDLDTRARKSAPLLTVAMLISAELLCRGSAEPPGKRFMAFVLLLMHWSTLRCDDVQNISPESITLSQLGLRAVLTKTKTSGPGKHAFVMRGVSLTGFDWLKEGYGMIHSGPLAWNRDYLVCPISENWEDLSKEFLDPEGLAPALRRLLQVLPVPTWKNGKWGVVAGTTLVPKEMSVFWSGHSARHWLPSVGAAAGVSEEHRDFLGRWAAGKGGSQTYVLTSRQIIHAAQCRVCAFLIEGAPGPGYIEEELHQSLLEFCAEHSIVIAGSSLVIRFCNGTRMPNLGI